MAFPILRVARPTDNLVALLRCYRAGLGRQVLTASAAHNGCAGVVPGHPRAAPPRPTTCWCFTCPRPAEWQVAVQRMQAPGFASVPFYNPYRDQLGRSFEDPDGSRMVLQMAA